MFQAIQLRLPNLPWLFGDPNVRILHLFAVGAGEDGVLLSALLLDAIWAAERSGAARLAMARLWPVRMPWPGCPLVLQRL